MAREIGMHSERKQTKMKMMMMMMKPYKAKQGCHTDQTEGGIEGEGEPRWMRPMGGGEKVKITR